MLYFHILHVDFVFLKLLACILFQMGAMDHVSWHVGLIALVLEMRFMCLLVNFMVLIQFSET